MKKISRLLFIFIFTLIFVPNVYAFKLGEAFTIRNDHNSTDSGLGFPSNMGYSKSIATQSSTRKSFEAFCIDRGKTPDASNFKVERLLPSSTSDTVTKYDYAALYIMNNSDKYNVKHYALRILTDVVQASFSNANADDYVNQEKALVKEFQNDPDFMNAYNAYGGAEFTTAVGYASDASKAFLVRDLLTEALNYAAEHAADNKPTKVEKGEEGQITRVVENDKIIYKKIVSVKIEINNIIGDGDNEYFKLTKAPEITVNNGANVEMIGVSKTFIDGTEGWEQLSSYNEDLSRKLDDRKGTLYLGFAITLQKDDRFDDVDENDTEEDCSVSMKLEYEYTSSFTGARISPSGVATQFTQRFLISSTEPTKGDFTLTTQLCSDTKCQPTVTMPAICEPGDTDKLKEWKNNDIQNPSDPDADADDIQKYLEYEFREAYNSDTKTYNIKKCLLKKGSKDIADNSYTYDGDSASAVSGNPYCEIKCKEDYKFGVPYKQTTEAGRYFQISVKIKGQQDCYTTKIDKEQYNRDIVDKQIEIADAYNEWLFYHENLTFINEVEWEVETSTWKKDTSDERKIPCNNVDDSDVDYPYYIVHSSNYINYTTSNGGQSITFTSGNVSDVFTNDTTKENNTYFGKYDSNQEPTCINAKTDWSIQKNDLETYRENAKARLRTAISELKTIVDKYNSCGDDKSYTSVSGDDAIKTSWDIVYTYDPYVKYSYQEPEPNNNSVSKWINEVQGKTGSTCAKGTCDIMVSPDEHVNSEFCLSDDIASGKCKYTTQVEDIDGNIHDTTWRCDGEVNNAYDTCSGSTGISYSTEKYLVCDIPDDGSDITCSNTASTSEFPVTNVKYVHKIATSNGTYNTAKVYFSGHDDGNIVIDPNALEKESYDRINGLPVGINTQTGTYYYILTLDNIGTFYDRSPELGRIFGSTGNSMSSKFNDPTKNIRPSETTVTDDNSGITIEGNQYACTYEVSQGDCVDENGKKHYKTECTEGEDWETCKARVCRNSSEPHYCVKESDGYYVCDNNYFDSSCQLKHNRDEALAEVGCVPGEKCERNYNCCPDCTVVCIDCILTPNPPKPSYDFKPVSPGNLFPTNRVIGFNWETDPTVYGNKLVARKAQDTRNEITTRATTETGNSGGGSSSVPTVEKYSLKVTMDTDMIMKIREYNKEQGTYNNDTLVCKDYILRDYDEARCTKSGYSYNESDSTCRMTNVFCYSTFIDKLIDDYASDGKVELTGGANNRATNKENFDNFGPYTGPDGATVSDVITNDYWTIYKFSSLDLNGDGLPDVGPSWK